MHYQASKHTKTDPLDAIMDHIQKNPHTYSDKDTSNERDDSQNTHMVNMGLKTMYKAADNNRQRKYVLAQGWSMKI